MAHLHEVGLGVLREIWRPRRWHWQVIRGAIAGGGTFGFKDPPMDEGPHIDEDSIESRGSGLWVGATTLEIDGRSRRVREVTVGLVTLHAS